MFAPTESSERKATVTPAYIPSFIYLYKSFFLPDMFPTSRAHNNLPFPDDSIH